VRRRKRISLDQDPDLVNELTEEKAGKILVAEILVEETLATEEVIVVEVVARQTSGVLTIAVTRIMADLAVTDS